MDPPVTGSENPETPPVPQGFTEAFNVLAETDVVPLVEAHVRKDGTVPIRIISPGWGSKGYYSEETLREADKNRTFPRGLKMFWDHPTSSEANERPERSLRDLAAVFDSDAKYNPNGPAGPGLYTNARVFEAYRPAIDELGAHIGPSIRAVGTARWGEAEGKAGPIIERILSAQSVDFVTSPGRGGEVLQLFEAARTRAFGAPESLWDPKTPEENNEVELQEAQRQLTASQAEVTRLTEALTAATGERDAERARAERANEALILQEARKHVAEALSKAAGLPDITKVRLLESTAFNPPVTDKGELDKDKLTVKIAEAVTAESTYIAAITGSGNVSGMGDGSAVPLTEAQTSEKLKGVFLELGLSESAAAIAAGGRGN